MRPDARPNPEPAGRTGNRLTKPAKPAKMLDIPKNRKARDVTKRKG